MARTNSHVVADGAFISGPRPKSSAKEEEVILQLRIQTPLASAKVQCAEWNLSLWKCV